MNFRRFLCISGLIVMCALGASAQFYPGPIQRASISNSVAIAAGQKCPMWCWAASVQMVAKSQDIDLSQEFIFSKVFGPWLQCKPSGNIQNIVSAINGVYKTTGNKTAVLQARAYYGNNGYAVPLIEAIQDNRPFIFLTQTHAMVATGVSWYAIYNVYNQPVGVQIVSIDLIDPYFTFGAQKYNTFYVTPYTAGNISGAIEIYKFDLSS